MKFRVDISYVYAMRQTKVLSMKNTEYNYSQIMKKRVMVLAQALWIQTRRLLLCFPNILCKRCDPGEQFLVEVLYQISRL